MHEEHRQAAESLGIDRCKSHILAIPLIDLILESLHKIVLKLTIVALLGLMDRHDRIHRTAGHSRLEAVGELHHKTHRATTTTRCAGAEQFRAIDNTLGYERIDEGHLQGVVTIHQLDALGIERGTI